MQRWRDLGLGRQKVVYALCGIIATMAVLASWMSSRIEAGVLATMASASAHYMENTVSPVLQELRADPRGLSPEASARLDALVADPVFRRQIVSVKVWASDGRLLYGPDKTLVGRRYPLSVQLLAALSGNVQIEYDSLTSEENQPEAALGMPLAEVYAPVYDESRQVIAVAEFYAVASSLRDELARTRLECWIIVSLISLLVLAALIGLISGDGATIVRQERALQDRVEQLSTLLTQNEHLNERLLDARRGAVETNERVLRRIGADLHDGPAQLIGLALLRLDNLVPEEGDPDVSLMRRELEKIRGALNSSLTEIRVLSSGIAPPALDRVEPRDAIEMAVGNHEDLTGTVVECRIGDLPRDLPALLKTCLYRFAQEGLTNAFRHAKGAGQTVVAGTDDDVMFLEVQDDGPGFALDYVPSAQRGLGLAGLRDRVESLGGTFIVTTEKGRSTVLRCEFNLKSLGMVDV